MLLTLAGRLGLAGRTASSGIVVGSVSGRCLAVDKPCQLEMVCIHLATGHRGHHHGQSVAETAEHHSADTLGPVNALPADLRHFAELVLGPDGLGVLVHLRPFWRALPPSFVLSIHFESP